MSKPHSGRLSGAADFLKASHIKRWGIVNTAKEQSVACHMWRVWLLVREWGHQVWLSPAQQAAAEEYALTHDLAEIRTGDMPTPHKTPEVKHWLEEVERSIFPMATPEPLVADLCKFCDTAEAVLFLRVHGLGRHAADVADLLEQQMHDRLGRSQLTGEQQGILRQLYRETADAT